MTLPKVRLKPKPNPSEQEDLALSVPLAIYETAFLQSSASVVVEQRVLRANGPLGRTLATAHRNGYGEGWTHALVIIMQKLGYRWGDIYAALQPKTSDEQAAQNEATKTYLARLMKMLQTGNYYISMELPGGDDEPPP
jgi:hypothetical protein